MTAAWLLLFAGAAVAVRRRPALMVIGALTVWCLVPALAVPDVGIPVAATFVHPGSAAVGVAVLVAFARHPRALTAVVGHRVEVLLLLGFVAVVAAAVTLAAHSGVAGLVIAFERIWVPALLLVLVGIAVRVRPDDAVLLRHTVVALAVAQSALALVEWVTGQPVLWSAAYREQVWFSSIAGRWMGTMDHPLVLSVLIAVAIPLLAGLRPGWVLPILPVLVGGMLVTQSRAGLAAAAVGLGYLLLRRRQSASTRLVMVLAGVSVLGLVTSTPLLDGVVTRFLDDTGSTTARVQAVGYFVANVDSHLWLGSGMNASYAVARAAGLGTSLENSFLMFAVDLGLVVAVVYYTTMVVCTLTALLPGRHHPLAVAGLIAIVLPLSFSGLAAPSALPVLVWALFALATYDSPTPRPGLATGPTGRLVLST